MEDELSILEYLAAIAFGCVVALGVAALVWDRVVRPRIWITPRA